MKNLLLGLLIFMTFSSTAQVGKGVFMELNLGTRIGGNSSDSVTLGAGYYMNGALGYWFSDKIGIRGTIGYNGFKTTGVNSNREDKSYMLSGTLEAVLSISQLANFGSDKFDLNFHTGFGFSSHFNPSAKSGFEKAKGEGYEWSDPGMKGADDMVNVVAGLTPTIHINEKISIPIDLSYMMLFNRDHTVDRNNRVKAEGMDGVFNISVGLVYRFGKNFSRPSM